MMDELEIYLRTRTELDAGDVLRIQSLASVRSLKRNEYLLKEGEICRYKTFVAKGLLRTFGTTADGSEHILQFLPEHSWAMDAESYDLQRPAKYNIAAIDHSQLMMWSKPDFDSLLIAIPKLKMYAEQLISTNIYSGRQRLLTALSASPEEKYQDFITSWPDLLPRLPLHMIAAYLGISLKTLTRIRHAQVRR